MHHKWKSTLVCLFSAQACAFITQRNAPKVSYSQSKDLSPSPFSNDVSSSSSSSTTSRANQVVGTRQTFVPLRQQKNAAFSFRRRERVVLASSKIDPGETKEGPTTIIAEARPNSTKEPVKASKQDDPIPSLPWSEFHDWALRDNIPKYTRILPGETPQTYALWRTMLQEVPELSGYPIDFLQTKFASKPLKMVYDDKFESRQNSNAATSVATAQGKVPALLPYLDNFQFEPSGGLSGQVYGVPGLRDGTSIETASVGQVEVTIPLGYVLTENSGIAYELGKPRAAESEAYSLDDVTQTASQAAGSLSKAAASNMAALARKKGGASSTGDEEDSNAMLVQLGAYTGLLLAGATAMSMLSHHLTVNVFWV